MFVFEISKYFNLDQLKAACNVLESDYNAFFGLATESFLHHMTNFLLELIIFFESWIAFEIFLQDLKVFNYLHSDHRLFSL